MPELPIAKGQAMVTWSGPELALQVTGTKETMVGQSVDYRVVLANPGDMEAQNVRLDMDLKNQNLQASFPNGDVDGPVQQTPTGAIWTLSIPAQRQFETIVRITPRTEGDYRIDFNATHPRILQRPQRFRF